MDSDARASEVDLARHVVAAVRDVPGVADVTPGQFVEVATYGPRERVPGVQVGLVDDGIAVEVHLCAEYATGLILSELADRVRSTVRQSVELLDSRPVTRIDVAIDDLRIGQESGR
jgi:uncharacterized alkaline shock family protein YloU